MNVISIGTREITYPLTPYRQQPVQCIAPLRLGVVVCTVMAAVRVEKGVRGYRVPR